MNIARPAPDASSVARRAAVALKLAIVVVGAFVLSVFTAGH